jgi:type IV pilus assembly protein PilA
MLTTLRERLREEDDGFTLIELMVVVLIIAILIAIAIPTFLGAQNRARERGAQSDLRNGMTAAKTIATDSEGKFLDNGGAVIDAADLTAVEGAVNFVDAAPATWDGEVVVVGDAVAPTGQNLTIYTESASGEAFCISATDGGDVTYGADPDPALVNTAGECQDSEW